LRECGRRQNATERRARSSRLISLTEREQVVVRVDKGAGKVAKVGVALDRREPVQVGEHRLEERLLVARRAGRAELGDPDRLAVLGADAADVVLEVGDVARRVVDVDRDRVDGAAGAGGEERVEPGGAHRRGAVGDRGRDELGAAGERLHVRLPRGSGGLRREVRLRGEVGLVEGEQVGRAAGDRRVGVGGPGRGVVRGGAPEHGHVLHARGKVAALARVPVVRPGNSEIHCQYAGRRRGTWSR
jgi:hypothetical protein